MEPALFAVADLEAKNRARRAEIERLRAALDSCQSWIDRWSNHVGYCRGGDKCTCGRTAVLFEAAMALREVNEQETGDTK